MKIPRIHSTLGTNHQNLRKIDHPCRREEPQEINNLENQESTINLLNVTTKKIEEIEEIEKTDLQEPATEEVLVVDLEAEEALN